MQELILPGVIHTEIWSGHLYLSLNESSDSLVQIIDLDRKKVIGKLIPAGNGPGEKQFVDDFGFYGGKMMAYDPFSYLLFAIKIKSLFGILK